MPPGRGGSPPCCRCPAGTGAGTGAEARLCACGWGSRSWRSCWCVSTDPHYPPPPNPSAAVFVLCPSLSPRLPPRDLPSSSLRPAVAVACTLHAPSCHSCIPRSTRILPDQRHEGKSFASIPLCCPAKVWQELVAPWLLSRELQLCSGHKELAPSCGMGTSPSPAGTAARGALLIACLSSAPCQLPEVESFWEDLRGQRATW